MQKIKTPKIKKTKNLIAKSKPIKIKLPKQNRKSSKDKIIVKSKSKRTIFNKMFGWLNNKYTFMFVPFSNKKGFALGFRVYALLIAVFLLLGTVTASVYLLTSRTVLVQRVHDATEEYENRKKSLGEFKLSLNNLLEQINYDSTITNIFEKANVVKKGTDIFSNSLEINDIQYISEISNIIENINISEKYINQIIVKMEEQKSTYLNIPNILPIRSELILSITPYETKNENGVYIESPPSTPIRATANASIQSISYSKENGYEIILEHSFNVISTYKGLGTLTINTDSKRVQKDQTIGYLGGNVFSKSLLDYKIKFGANYINPLFVTIN